jgi:hypothetical protein
VSKPRRTDRQATQERMTLALVEAFLASGRPAVHVTADAVPSRRLAMVMNNLAAAWGLPARASADGSRVLLRRTGEGG